MINKNRKLVIRRIRSLLFAFAVLFAGRLKVLFLIFDDSILLFVRLGLDLDLLGLLGFFAIGAVGSVLRCWLLLSVLLLRLLVGLCVVFF